MLMVPGIIDDSNDITGTILQPSESPIVIGQAVQLREQVWELPNRYLRDLTL